MRTKLQPNSSIHLRMCSNILHHIDTNRHILRTKFLPKNHLFALIFRSLPILLTSYLLLNTWMATNNIELLIKCAIIMTRSKKLSLTLMHPNSNIDKMIFVVYLKVDKKKFSRRPLGISQYICFEQNLCSVVCTGMEEPFKRGHSNTLVLWIAMFEWPVLIKKINREPFG